MQNFWTRPIKANNIVAVGSEGGKCGMELVGGTAVVSSLVCLPFTAGVSVLGLFFGLFTLIPAYVTGYLLAIFVYMLIRPVYRLLGHTGSISYVIAVFAGITWCITQYVAPAWDTA